MFKPKAFAINYLGNSSGYNFFVDIGNVNEIIYGTSLYNSFFNPSVNATYNQDVRDVLLYNVSSFGPVGDDGEIGRYISPLKTSVTLSESGSIYLKIPRIPMGSDNTNNVLRPIWFATRVYVPNSLSADQKFWVDKFEIVTTIDPNDFIYEQRYDHLQQSISAGTPVEFPQTKYPQIGAIYIKLADIQIQDNSVKIIPYFQSNVINPNRYVTLGNNFLRNCLVYYWGYTHIKGSQYPTFGYYSRPNWVIKTFDQIFAVAKSEIEEDFVRYYNNWEYSTLEGKADFLEIKQLLAVYTVYSNREVRVKKIFEDLSGIDEPDIYPLNEDNLPFIFPGLNSENAIIE